MRGSMQNVAPLINHAHRGGMLRLAFLSAVVSLVVLFAAAAAPIALYNIYRAEDGFTNAGISMAIVAYAVGTIAALLVLDDCPIIWAAGSLRSLASACSCWAVCCC
jgi:hypothetical protein